ncbi:MAG: SAM-dependent methyltransferase [Flavobacteriaceae bacterium]|nr:SAM-dependent methyltransferase [Flavobacteriaceae bacterium]
MSDRPGKLYLIPTRLGDNPPLEVLPISVKKIVEMIDEYIVENEKSARRFIKKISSRKSQSSLKMKVLNKYTQDEEFAGLLDACREGRDMGLLSEAGCPAIADPGSEVVSMAHEENIQVIPMVGPSSIILALMGSGMNGQNFAFNGYLPIDSKERKKALKKIERRSLEEFQSQIFIETPYRNTKLLEEMLGTLHPNTRLCVACDLTLPTEQILTKTVVEWRNFKIDLHKRPTIFIIQGN